MLQWPVQRAANRKVERIPKSRSQFGLEVCNSTSMKLESLVIADQQRRGEYVPGPCTHRPSQSRKSVTPEAGGLTLVEGAVEGGSGDWD